MLSQSLVYAPLVALLVACGWGVGRFQQQRRSLLERLMRLEQSLDDLRAELSRSEAARTEAQAALRSAE